MESIFIMQNKIMKNMLWLGLAICILLFDQFTKFLAMRALDFGVSKSLIPGLSFTLAHNTGAAFSLFNQGNGWQIILFTILAMFVSIYLIIWLFRLQEENNITKLAICLILGGSLGNMIDRLSYGYVIDFIALYYKNYHWPIFNIADSGITIGAGILLYEFFYKRNYNS